MIGAPELLMTAFMVVFPAVGLYLAYWVIRLGVRHGMQDAQRTASVPGRLPRPTPEMSSTGDSVTQ
jgi:hypothetical protein